MWRLCRKLIFNIIVGSGLLEKRGIQDKWNDVRSMC